MDQINQIDHIGIAVESLDNQIPLYRDLFGLGFHGREVVESESVEIAFFRVGDVDIELLEPTSEESAIAGFLDRHGGGLHHIALACDDIEAARKFLSNNDIRLLSDEPKQGGHNKLITFLHPKDTGKVLYELTQRQE
jgi:methylmalonyl-CoA/ethylmalonyl-CoA epimerase